MLKFKVGKGSITLDDIIAFESKSIGPKKIVLAKCLVNEDGTKVPIEEAVKIIGRVDIFDLENVVKSFLEAVEAARNTALPPNGGVA